MVSFQLSITSRSSEALLDNSSFKENCLVMSIISAGITVINSTFQSYRHRFGSMITAYSSVVTLSGNVNFTDSTTGILQDQLSFSGTAVLIMTTQYHK